ncbi:MAG: Na+/H+ antiporter NhaC family protein [Aureispira sp.]|nr:Na+/H+ antiporter NhaC family protein [Aureispira sp.]
MTRYTLGLLISLLFSQIIWAQDTLNTINPIDSIETDSIAWDTVPEQPQVLEPSFDTVGIADFSIAMNKGVELTVLSLAGGKAIEEQFVSHVVVDGEDHYLLFKDGKTVLPHEAGYKGELLNIQSKYTECKINEKTQKQVCLEQKVTRLLHLKKNKNGTFRSQPIPLWWSIVPPLVAILLALIFRQVLLALFTGILAGAWIVNGMPLSPYELMKSFFEVLDTYILGAMTDTGHLSVIIFSLMIGGVVALISRNGGMAGIVKKLSPLARGPKSTQFVAWLLGIAIFFDDYANTLIVGNTIRPLTDKYKISREKLAYIVDSTAAPIAAIAFITTWIGAELGYIGDELPKLAGLENPPSPYSVFLSSLSYSFYSVFTLFFILIIIYTGRDFGPMFRAEKRARTTGRVFETAGDKASEEDLEELEPVEGAPLRWINGLLPIFVVVFGTLLGLVDTGMQSCYDALVADGIAVAHNGWSEVWSHIHNLDSGTDIGVGRKMGILIGNADSYAALLWASISAVMVGIIMTVLQRIMKLNEAINTTVTGFKTMMPALLILILAWALATTTEELSTAEFLTSLLGDSVSPYFVPVIIFILAALIAFSTGSSWSTMAILYPIAIPMTWTIAQHAGLDIDTSMELLYNVIAVVLAASVLGDHCSPISDTTILSSLASNCNHIDHVRTQLPYALLVGTVSIVMTYVSTAFGTPFLLNFVVGLLVLFGFVLVVGKRIETE